MVQNPTFETLAMVSALVVKAEAAKKAFNEAEVESHNADEALGDYLRENLVNRVCDLTEEYMTINNNSIKATSNRKKADKAYSKSLDKLAEALNCYDYESQSYDDERVCEYLLKSWERNSALHLMKCMVIDLAKHIEL